MNTVDYNSYQNNRDYQTNMSMNETSSQEDLEVYLACSQVTSPTSVSTGRSNRSRKLTSPCTKNVHVEKNTEGKPRYSYATLIKYAIENSEKKMLTLSEIYQWVMDHYPYYITAGTGWKNSIRHNLSLNKCFVRIPRPINEPGKGSYWQLNHCISETDKYEKVTVRNRECRSDSDPVKAPYLPDDPQYFYRDARSLSLDSTENSGVYYPAHFSYDKLHHHHQYHHHHHHHRHSLDSQRNHHYLTNYGMYASQSYQRPIQNIHQVSDSHVSKACPTSSSSAPNNTLL